MPFRPITHSQSGVSASSLGFDPGGIRSPPLQLCEKGQRKSAGRMSPDRGRKARTTKQLPGIPTYLGQIMYFTTTTFGSIKLFDELSRRAGFTGRVIDPNVPATFSYIVENFPIDSQFIL